MKRVPKQPSPESLEKMASSIEEHMTEKGMSEEEKDERVARFAPPRQRQARHS